MKYPTREDIQDMKTRGYDPQTIAEAEEQLKRGIRAQEICEIVRKAFAGVKLGKGVGLQEAQGLDDYEGEAACAAYRSKDEKENWESITIEELNRCNSSLSFFDAKGMRFHLPAYLIADLNGDYGFGVAFSLTHLSDYSTQQFSLLSESQRNAVRTFLLHIQDDPEYELDRPHIVRALEEYWTRQESNGDSNS
jgi:hypothetical protein